MRFESMAAAAVALAAQAPAVPATGGGEISGALPIGAYGLCVGADAAVDVVPRGRRTTVRMPGGARVPVARTSRRVDASRVDSTASLVAPADTTWKGVPVVAIGTRRVDNAESESMIETWVAFRTTPGQLAVAMGRTTGTRAAPRTLDDQGPLVFGGAEWIEEADGATRLVCAHDA